jgi:class 3 adenylate cyclase/tetratricopeptide (TPR) repeat protein
MECPKCQSENLQEAKFCGKCGAKLSLVCTQCSYENTPGNNFCIECGHDLSLPSEPVPRELSFDEKIDKIQRYLPKGLTEKILSQRDKIEGERKQVTVMFCDMEGYSQLSERLGPEEAYGIMDQVYEILIHKVHDYEGTVNEMTGDGIMALFGAPIALEDAPQRAIRSAMAIHREMAKFSDRMKEEREGIPPIKIRVGIHTGPVVVGTLGNDLRVEFKAVGETVNLASRMEGLAQPGATYVTEDVFKLTEGFFRFEALGDKEVKGKKETISVYRAIALSTRRTRFDVNAERGLTPFVGRERELELLLDGFERAKTGRGQAFSIMAEAGIGKSRLLYEFRKAVSNEDVTFLEGKCLSYSRGAAYHPVIDILKSNFDIQEEDGDFEIKEKVTGGLKVLGADETATLPYLLELLSVQDSGVDDFSLSPEARRDRIIEALNRIVLKGSEIRPLIIAIEDLHWIDKSSEESYKSLLDSISGARVFLIFTYRPEFVHTWGGRSYHSQLNLNRLSNRESLNMVRHVLGTDDIHKDLEEFILEKTEGVPFFIEEFLKSLIELRIIEKKGNRYQLVKDIKEVMVPSTVQDVIMARVDSLPEGPKGVLQIGSVVGREFSKDLIQKVIGQSENELLTHLSVLKDSELLYERGIYPQSIYIFRHALTQEVTYNSLLLKRRNEVHETIGSAIESLYSERLDEFYEIVAYHYSESDNHEKAYKYLTLSGNKTTRNYSNWEAFRFYKEAIRAVNQLPETLDNNRKQIEVILLMASPMMYLAFPEDSLRILKEGERLSKHVDDRKSLAIVYSLIGIYYMHKGKPLDAIRYSEIAFEEPQKLQDIELVAPIGRGLCISYIAAGEFRKTCDIAPKIIDLLEKTKRESDFFDAPFNTYSLLCSYYGISLAMLGNFEKGMSYIERGISAILPINHLATLGVAETQYGLSFVAKGDGTNAIEHFQESIRYFEEGKTVLIFSLIWSGLGSGYYYLGDFEVARKHLEKGLDITIHGGSQFWSSFHYLYLSKTHFELGNQKTSRSFIEDALKLSQEKSERHFEGASWTWLGRILGKTDASQSDKAEEFILKGIRILDEMKIKPWSSEGLLYLGELYADIGKRENALENLNKAEGHFKEMGMDYWLVKTQEVLGRV